MPPPVRADATIIRKAVIALATVLVALFVGMSVPSRGIMIFALLGGGMVVMLLLNRPVYFMLMLFFVLFEAFDIVDLEHYARLPGYFRAKDVMVVLIVGFFVANEALHHHPEGLLRASRMTTPILLFLIFVVFQMWYTKVFLHEGPVLLFRQSRHFLTYGVPLLIILYFRREADWELLDRFCLFFVVLTAVLNTLDAVIDLPFIHSVGRRSVEKLGVFKSLNPAILLTYWYFFRKLWLFIERPTRRNAKWLMVLSYAMLFYLFRGSVVAGVAGLAVASLVAPRYKRARLWSVLGVLGVCMVVVALILAATADASSTASVGERMKDYFASTFTDFFNQEGTYGSRVQADQYRYPLIKEHPFLGIGFISMFGQVAYDIWRTQNVLPVGTVDTGWVDLMLRLGSIGCIVLLLVFAQSVRVNAALSRQGTNWKPEERAILLANIALSVMVVVNLIAAGFLSWEPTILTIGLCFAWTMRLEEKYRKIAAIAKVEKGAERPKPIRHYFGGPSRISHRL